MQRKKHNKHMNQNQYFKEKIDTLPEDLQYAIWTSEWEASLSMLQKKYKLHLDQGQVLESATTRLMFGDIDASGFINTMFNDGHISSQVAAEILLEVDERILKRIRTAIEAYAQSEENQKEFDRLMMDDDEREEDDRAEEYAKYYADVNKILEETEAKILEEGILPDGSNITEEHIAKALGMTIEEYKKSQTPNSKDESVLPENISKEKEELLHELESPQKSFVRSFTKPVEYKLDHEPLKPDHQIENVHIEEPYHEPVVPVVAATAVEAPAPVSAPVAPVVTPEIKRPTKISMPNDMYREPIE